MNLSKIIKDKRKRYYLNTDTRNTPHKFASSVTSKKEKDIYSALSRTALTKVFYKIVFEAVQELTPVVIG